MFVFVNFCWNAFFANDHKIKQGVASKAIFYEKENFYVETQKS